MSSPPSSCPHWSETASTESRAHLSGGADGREVDSKVSGRRGEIKVVERGQMEVWEYLILMFVFM